MKRIFVKLLFAVTIMATMTGCVTYSTKAHIDAEAIPEYAKAEAARYTQEFMAKNSQAASDLQHRFYYDQIGQACMEYTVTPKEGYVWKDTTWVGNTWGNYKGTIGNNEIHYTLSRRNVDQAELRMEERRKDPVFRSIEELVYQIAVEYDYDYDSAYNIKVKYRNPQAKMAVCDGYSDAVMDRLIAHPEVVKLEKWGGGDHAWNTIFLKDGRKLYCDVTWYDGNKIDDQGYVVEIPERNPTNLTFDIDEFNSLGGARDFGTKSKLRVHFNFKDAKLIGERTGS